jgi:hypothetical protein
MLEEMTAAHAVEDGHDGLPRCQGLGIPPSDISQDVGLEDRDGQDIAHEVQSVRLAAARLCRLLDTLLAVRSPARRVIGGLSRLAS